MYQRIIIIGNKGCEDVHLDCKIAQLEAELAARDALIERLVGAGIEINSCTKVSTFSAEYYTLCKAQREWNEAVTDWEILKGGEK